MRSIDLFVDNVSHSVEFYTRYFQACLISESDCGATLSLDPQRQLRLHDLAGAPRPGLSPDLCVTLSAPSLTRLMLDPGLLRSVFQAGRAPNTGQLPLRAFDPDGHAWAVCHSDSGSLPTARHSG